MLGNKECFAIFINTMYDIMAYPFCVIHQRDLTSRCRRRTVSIVIYINLGVLVAVYNLNRWVQLTDPALPRGDRFMAVGHYTDSIYMLKVHSHHIASL